MNAPVTTKLVCLILVPISPRPEQRHGEVEEAPEGGRVGHVGAEVDGRGVDLRVGAHVGHGREEIVHHARVVGVVDGRAVEPEIRRARKL